MINFFSKGSSDQRQESLELLRDAFKVLQADPRKQNISNEQSADDEVHSARQCLVANR